MRLVYSARSHVGFVRDKNEDNLFVNGIYADSVSRNYPFIIDGYSEKPAVFAVCDGMGGEDSGEKASLIAAELLKESSVDIIRAAQKNTQKSVQKYINKVNEHIQDLCSGTGRRIGTTLALAVITGKGVRCFNLGDSRIYRLKKSGLQRVTNDHTFSADKVKCGIITESEVAFDSDRHKLTKCIGIGSDHIAEGYPLFRKKSRVLICSDGLTDMVSEDQIEKILQDYKNTSAAADALLETALKNGGRDNVSVILVDVSFISAVLYRILNKFGGNKSI